MNNFQELFERIKKLKKLNEEQTAPLITIVKITDCDSEYCAQDEFDFAIEGTLEDEAKRDLEFKKRLAKFMRETADMLEREE